MADHSALKKPKASNLHATKNKREDKFSKITEHKSQLSHNLSIDRTEESNLKEPYQCTGKFIDDFTNICRQNQISSVPPIIHRQKRPLTPTTTNEPAKVEKKHTMQNKKHTASNLDTSQTDLLQNSSYVTNPKHQSILSFNEEETREDSSASEPLPKTFLLVKDRLEYFKPKIQVEVDHADKHESVTEVYIRGWKIETQIMNAFQETLPFAEKIVSINLWNCGLNEESLDMLATFLPKCLNLKNVNLDGNPVKDQSFYKLINGSNTQIQYLSLRNCDITDLGAEKLGKCIGNVHEQNTKLISLNLSANQIGDQGAIELANGLRTNRTLLVLNLAGNQIGDVGASRLAETLSRFKMTQEEITKRRLIKRDRILKELATIPRRNKTEDTIGSLSPSKSPTKQDAQSRGAKSDKNKENTTSKAPKRDAHSGRESSNEKTQPGGKTTKKDQKDAGDKAGGSGNIKKGHSKESLISNAETKGATKGGTKPKSPKKSKESETSETDFNRIGSGKLSSANIFANINEPLMDEAEGIDGDLWIVGNRTLISLNLSRNKITCLGLKKFILTIQYQMTMSEFNKGNGLLKLNLNKNNISLKDEDFVKLNEIMKKRDPIMNVQKLSEAQLQLQQQQQQQQSHHLDVISSVSIKEGKETSRSKSSVRK